LAKALGAHRKDTIVVTKGGLPTRQQQREERDRRDSRRASVLQDIEDSLRNLSTDYIDLYLIHWPDVETPFAETMATLNDIVKAGKARYIGVSNFSADQLRESRAVAPICANQVGYNLFDRRWEREMFPTAQELGIGVMAYGPMAHGLLTGAMGRATAFDPQDWRASGMIFGQHLFGPQNLPRNLEVVEQLKAVADRLGTSLPRLALAWVLRHPAVSVALSGCRTPGEIEENVRALEVTLPPDVPGELERIMAGAAGQVEAVPGQHHLPGVPRGVGVITGNAPPARP
jgi:aryl-alcohol dehydrogenase-like predicted oxidoreductase